MATTALTMIEEALRLIHGGGREQYNVLASTPDADDTTLTFTHAIDEISVGAVLCIDLELMYVWTKNDTAKTAEVYRGWRGSTGAAHTPGTLVEVNPRFSRFDLFTEINHDLHSLSAEGLFQVKNVDLTYNSSVRGYDLTSVTSLLSILEVKYADTGPEKTWPLIPMNKYDLRRNSSTTDFASGLALVLHESAQPGRAVRVTYSAPFAQFTALTSDAQSVAGLAESMNDLPPLGAGMRLSAFRELKRNFGEAQGDTRRPVEVPPGANLGAYRALADHRLRRIQAEKARLLGLYPPRHRVR